MCRCWISPRWWRRGCSSAWSVRLSGRVLGELPHCTTTAGRRRRTPSAGRFTVTASEKTTLNKKPLGLTFAIKPSGFFRQLVCPRALREESDRKAYRGGWPVAGSMLGHVLAAPAPDARGARSSTRRGGTREVDSGVTSTFAAPAITDCPSTL